nr:diaminopimelate decarboxylase [Elusimicrobiota bacterium]
EIEKAIKEGILQINIESSQELDTVNEIAGREGKKANIALRINPDIDPKTHPKISTGLKESKFGIPEDKAVKVYKDAANMENINIVGVHLHIGSQITEIKPFELTAKASVSFSDRLKEEGIELDNIDIGGGLGIGYETPQTLTASDIYNTIDKYFSGRKEKLILEPGRSLVGNAGYLLTKINFIKKGSNKNFVVVDAGFNDLIRPAMYDAYHEIAPVTLKGDTLVADVVGPVCETGDHIALNRKVSGVKRGNILAVCDSGAYGFSMASNYNSRLRPAEIMLDNGEARIIRKREDYSDLTRNEV